MSDWLNQDAVADKLTRKAGEIFQERIEDPYRERMKALWKVALADMKAHLAGLLHQASRLSADGKRKAAPGRAIAMALQPRMEDYVHHRIERFTQDAIDLVYAGRMNAHRLQRQLTSWVLDQTTPPNLRVRPRLPDHFREAYTTDPVTGELVEDKPTPAQRTSAWTRAWELGAIATLGMVLNRGGDPDEAGARVDGVKADGYDLGAAMDRVISGEVNIAAGDGVGRVDDEWDNVIDKWTWLTLYGTGRLDSVVCEWCEERNGEEMTDALWAEYEERHPFCRCQPKVQPKDFQALAGAVGHPDADPRDMVIVDPATGKPIGSVVVEFAQWLGGE